jgi:hypothetical protein
VCRQWVSLLTNVGSNVVALGLLYVQIEKYVNKNVQSVGQVCPPARSPDLVTTPLPIRNSDGPPPTMLILHNR